MRVFSSLCNGRGKGRGRLGEGTSVVLLCSTVMKLFVRRQSLQYDAQKGRFTVNVPIFRLSHVSAIRFG